MYVETRVVIKIAYHIKEEEQEQAPQIQLLIYRIKQLNQPEKFLEYHHHSQVSKEQSLKRVAIDQVKVTKTPKEEGEGNTNPTVYIPNKTIEPSRKVS